MAWPSFLSPCQDAKGCWRVCRVGIIGNGIIVDPKDDLQPNEQRGQSGCRRFVRFPTFFWFPARAFCILLSAEQLATCKSIQAWRRGCLFATCKLCSCGNLHAPATKCRWLIFIAAQPHWFVLSPSRAFSVYICASCICS